MSSIRPGLVLMLVLAVTPRAGRADAAEPADGQWFVPPAVRPGAAATVDLSHPGAVETITVIGERVRRSWASPDNAARPDDPDNADAARHRWSSRSFAPSRPYCNSALRTVGGQPASAGDVAVGAGTAAC